MIFPNFCLWDKPLVCSSEVKYLGHFLTDDLRDDRDIQRQYSKLYAQANTLLRKFSMCSANVKRALFRAYCTPLYTAPLRWNYRQGIIRRLTVAYNDTFRLLMRVPRWHSSASQLFVDAHIPTCEALQRHLMFKFKQRLEESENSIIKTLTNPQLSSCRYTSLLRKHWMDKLFNCTLD